MENRKENNNGISISGQGLGKASDGIVKPIKATFKFDNTGLGHDSAKDFNNHWWERVYNDAASNVKVSSGSGAGSASGKTQIETREEDAVDISTSSINFKKMKKKHGKMAGFGSFIKTATLTNLGKEAAVEEQVNLEEFRHATVKPLTDEELFAACGGRTAHKGARHGLKLSGKLARMAEQDALMLAKLQPGASVPSEDADAELLAGILYQAEYSKKLSKRKRKKLNRIDNELSESMDSFSLQSQTKAEEEEQALHRLNDQHGGSVGKRKTGKTVKRMVQTFLDDIRGSKSDEEAPVGKQKKASKKGGSLKKYKSDEELNVVQKREKKKGSKRKERVYIEPEESVEGSMCIDSETDVTELEDSLVGDQGKLSARKKRLSKEMKPKRKRNRDQKEEKKLAKALAASLNVSRMDDEEL